MQPWPPVEPMRLAPGGLGRACGVRFTQRQPGSGEVVLLSGKRHRLEVGNHRLAAGFKFWLLPLARGMTLGELLKLYGSVSSSIK